MYNGLSYELILRFEMFRQMSPWPLGSSEIFTISCEQFLESTRKINVLRVNKSPPWGQKQEILNALVVLLHQKLFF